MKHRKRSVAFLLAMLMILSPVSAFAQTVDLPKAEAEVTESAVEAPVLPEENLEETDVPQGTTPPVSEQTFAEAPVAEQEAQAEPETPVEEQEKAQETEAPAEEQEAPAEEVSQEPTEAPAEEQVAEEPVEEALQAVTALAEEKTADDNELEIDGTSRPEDNAVQGGGSSGGGGGGSSSGGSGSGGARRSGPATNNRIVIQKLNEKQQPMSVVFRVTNQQTGESHLVVTDQDEDGYSGTITFSRLNNIDWLEIGSMTSWNAGYYATITPGDAEKGLKVANPDIFAKVPAPQPMPEPANENDTYKEPGQEKDLYEHADELIPGGEVRFENPPLNNDPIPGTITLTIHYGNKHHENADAFDPTDYEYSEEFTYENVNADQMNRLNEFALKSFAEKRLVALSELGECSLDDQGRYMTSVVFTPKEDKPIEHIYKFEELRTPSNQNYQLETFYVKYSSDGSLLWGRDKNEITTPITDFAYYPKTRVRPGGGGKVLAPQNPGPLRSDDGSTSGSEGAFKGYPDIDIPDVPVPPPVDPVPNPGGEHPPIPPQPKEYKHNHIGLLLRINNQPFEFNTVATDGTDAKDNKSVEKGEQTQVVDKVTYKGLTAGKDYKLIGKIYRKPKSGDVTEADFVHKEEFDLKNLKSSDGEKDLTFTFDTTKYQEGDEFVIVYEILESGVPAGDEKDFQSKSQSFTLKGKTTPPKDEEPKDPPKPEEPPTPEEPPKPEDPPTPEEPPTPEVPHVHVPVKVSMPPVRIPTAGVGR